MHTILYSTNLKPGCQPYLEVVLPQRNLYVVVMKQHKLILRLGVTLSIKACKTDVKMVDRKPILEPESTLFTIYFVQQNML